MADDPPALSYGVINADGTFDPTRIFTPDPPAPEDLAEGETYTTMLFGWDPDPAVSLFKWAGDEEPGATGWLDTELVEADDMIQPFKLFLRLSGSQLTALRTSTDDDIQNALFLLTFSQVDGVRLNDEVVTGLADAMVTAGIFDSAARTVFLAAP